MKDTKDELNKIKTSSRKEIDRLKAEIDIKQAVNQKALKDIMKERKDKVNNEMEAKKAQLELKEQNTRNIELEDLPKNKDTELDNKRKALQDLQSHYQTQLDNDLRQKQECAEKEAKMNEFEGEINRLKNYPHS